MNRRLWCAALFSLLALDGGAQTSQDRVDAIVPQAGVLGNAAAQIRIDDVRVGVVIRDQLATTTLEVGLRNLSHQAHPCEMLLPVPRDVVLRGFDFQGRGAEPSAALFGQKQAREAYDAIVARIRDPALLEFAASSLVRSSVFPVPPLGTQRVRLTYEQLLPVVSGRADYFFPRSEVLGGSIRFDFSARIEGSRPISAVYSPSHPLQQVRLSETSLALKSVEKDAFDAGSVQVSILYEDLPVSASLFAYPDPKTQGGYFLLLAGLPTRRPEGVEPIAREITLVLDRSGSMKGGKLDQVTRAATKIIDELGEADRFNLISYNEGVRPFASRPVEPSAKNIADATTFLKRLTPRGGTNIHDALFEALRQERAADAKSLPLILFLTDGEATVGETREGAIRELVERSNGHQRRIFAIGVGYDLQSALLSDLATESNGDATFILPGEPIEGRIDELRSHIAGPVFSNVDMEILHVDGTRAPNRIDDVVPSRLPDLFDGDQLVLLGRYVGEDPLRVRIAGDLFGVHRQFDFEFDLAVAASTRHDFVPRLWATRKIAVLNDAIRRLGADRATVATLGERDPKLRELLGEVMDLSTKFGVLSEYTAFLATEGTDLSDSNEILDRAEQTFRNRALAIRGGEAGVSQEINRRASLTRVVRNRANRFVDATMNWVAAEDGVRQVDDLTFFHRRGRWIDGRLVGSSKLTQFREIEFGTAAYQNVTRRLVVSGRSGCLALPGDVMVDLEGQVLLLRNGDAVKRSR